MKSQSIQSITGNGQSIVFDVSKVTNIIFHPKGTFAGVNVTFEASVDGGVTWVGIQVARSNANTIETTSGALSAAPAYSYRASVAGYNKFRVRSTAWTSGTQIWTVSGFNAAIDPAPAVQSALTVTTTEGTKVNPTAHNHNSAASTNATSVKTTAGNLYQISASNINAATRYLKLYNKASAPTVGTDTPVLTIPLPAASVQNIEFGATGHRFTTGIAFAITVSAADSATDGVAAGEIKVVTTYI